MKIIIFEDAKYNDFFPITLTRPVWDIRCGLFTMWERYATLFATSFPHNIYFYTRHHLEAIAHIQYPNLHINKPATLQPNEELLFINARIVYPELSNIQKNTVYLYNGIPVLAKMHEGSMLQCTTTEDVQNYLQSITSCCKYNGYVMTSLWELINSNGEIITKDFLLKKNSGVQSNVTIIGDSSQLIIEDDVTIEPYVVVDCTRGPVYIGKGCALKAFTRIEGPCCIGHNSVLLQAKVREGCSIGPWCRIGGEVEETIFHGFVNKYHEGFIGHSYIGQWVNLGALTTNSDLKNNYTTVKLFIGDEKINTQLLKVGCFIGDFTMTSIGTLINTGTVMGPGCMVIHSGDITPKFIPPFTWYIDGHIVDLPSEDKFYATCKTMMSRRDVEFTVEYKKMLEEVRVQTKLYRKGIGKWNVQK
ncbi:MAG: putative sugar nucleotidyl transferase [Spirochaetes bacterium]|nr:putative sugar nucleotidyl transferase [Spirochaetota bacterium]